MQTASHQKCPHGHVPHILRWLFTLAVVLFSATLQHGRARAELTTVYSFGAPSGFALNELCEGPLGTFYTTARTGGRFGKGVVLRLSRFGDVSVLHSFDGTNGSAPTAGLTRGRDGNYYGTTSADGAFGYGTAFRITPSGALTTLHSFTLAEGSGPHAALLLASDGNFYGSTRPFSDFDPETGTFRYMTFGSLFRLTPSGSLTVLHSFSGADGSGSEFPLLQARDGHLYGTTPALPVVGEPHPAFVNFGTIFRLTLAGEWRALHTFDGITAADPLNLVELDDGFLYGATGGVVRWGAPEATPSLFYRVSPAGDVQPLRTIGGSPPWQLFAAPGGILYGLQERAESGATLVRISPRGRVSTLYEFAAGSGSPWHLSRTETGAWYGTTPSTFFRIVGGDLRVLAEFGYPFGSTPSSALLRASDGNFYGTTGGGGEHGFGTVYRMSRAGSVSLVASFTRPERAGDLVEARGGALYYAGYVSNSVGRVTKRGARSIVYTFPNVANPISPLVQGPDDALYTVAQSSAETSASSVFRITSSGAASALYGFDDLDARYPSVTAPLTLGRDGLLYGTTLYGGANDSGVVYRVSTEGAATTVYTFPAGSGTSSGLVTGPDGNLYGTTALDGLGGGTIFRVTPAGVLTTLHQFVRGDPASGYWPSGTLTIAADGTIFGVTLFGPNDAPTVFRVRPDGTHKMLHDFGAPSFGPWAATPRPSTLTLDDRGRLYGTLSAGGSDDMGSIFRIDPQP